MGQKIVQVDAFTDRPFAGNPAAVCVMSSPRDERWMQNVALEMNLSETAFLHRVEDGYSLRWFTPTVEVDLCGHATLATAHVLWEEGFLPPEAVARFQTRSGLLTAKREGKWIELDFPARAIGPATGSVDELSRALNVPVRLVAFNEYDCLAEVESEAVVRSLVPDMTRLSAIPVRGVIVTARASTAGFDFVSRFFAPRVGIDEDPVCGSAHCALAPYWSDRLGKSELVGYQASPRGGAVRVRVSGSRVHLGGQAVIVLRGELADSTGID
ncbi:PhzF family phenazine biosynthesis protein [Singulisphaera acidiphila]|uniref:Phenazine biosynthesis protein PhzF family n=1 Tax=Singulisphaera acidiphila (strain ATCC BAA-1392 / DSM 18658 / VKM B-2454 / MOB10) TaxID=886293 RepID=L0D7H6_SINAD|nr:PhzF family phenazine biosynthesis protein [Singulisphaera acidiphila]AGA25197.1 phenazine biosynthesis protein PhzF family [Singulisphaera acidiphila DSM 18658]